jgi:hypothetical protein
MTHDPRAPEDAQRAQQAATAAWCGYGTGPEAVLELNRLHDPYHVVAGRLLGQHYSPTLRWVATGYRQRAHPTRHDDAVGFEESLVLELQRWMRTGEYGGTMRVLWTLGWDEDDVRAALRNAVGEGRP